MRPFTVAEVIGAVRAAADDYSIPPDAELVEIAVDPDDACLTVALKWDDDGTPKGKAFFRSRLVYRLLLMEQGVVLNQEEPTPDNLVLGDDVEIEVNGETV